MTDLAVHVLEPNRRLDAIDRKILTVLQEDASLSVAEIGDRVGLSSTPCWKRIQRLEADGVILRRVVVADMQSYDVFYKKLISAVPLKNVTSRFAMEKIKSVTALPVPAA